MPENDLTGLKAFIYDAYSGIIQTSSFNQDLLLIDNQDAGFMATIWTLLLPLAYGLVLLYFVLYVFEETSNGKREKDIKFLFLSLFKLGVVELVLSYGPFIISCLIGIGNWMVRLFIDNPITAADSSLDADTFYQALYNTVKDMGFWEGLGNFIYALIIKIITLIPAFMIGLHAVSRKVELILRGGFTAIAIPNLFSDGMRSGAIHYFKRFAACMVHGAVILLIVQITGALSVKNLVTIVQGSITGATIQLDFNTLVMTALYSFAAVGLISATKQMVNDIFG